MFYHSSEKNFSVRHVWMVFMRMWKSNPYILHTCNELEMRKQILMGRYFCVFISVTYISAFSFQLPIWCLTDWSAALQLARQAINSRPNHAYTHLSLITITHHDFEQWSMKNRLLLEVWNAIFHCDNDILWQSVTACIALLPYKDFIVYKRLR